MTRALRFAALTALLVALMQAPPLAAAEVGNPARLLDGGGLGLTLGAVLRDRTLSGDDEADLDELSLAVEYGVADFLTVYGRTGLAEMSTRRFDSDLEPSLFPLRLGGRAVVYSIPPRSYSLGRLESEELPIDLAVDLQVGFYRFEGDSRPEGRHAEADLGEIQGAVAVATRWKALRPYGGLKLSFLNADLESSRGAGGMALKSRSDFRADSLPSLFAGTDLELSSGLGLNFEVSLFAEMLLSAGMTYRF